MSVMVRIAHRTPDFDKWRRGFDTDPANRAASGVLRYRVSRWRDETDVVMIDLEFATDSDAEAFVRRIEVVWRNAGAALIREPTARIVEVVERAAVC